MSTYAAHLADDAVVVYLFHGVIQEQRHAVRNYTGKHLPRPRFVEVLDRLTNAGEPVAMADLVAAAQGRKSLPPHAWAVTFDDGFQNNYAIAAPILEARRIPATFYVTTEFVSDNRCAWIDEIEYAVERTTGFTLDLPFAGPHERYTTVTEKRDLLDAVRRFVKADRRLDPYEVAAEVWRQLGVTSMIYDWELDEKMSWAEVRELSRHPLFTVGGHGHSHRILEYLDDGDLEREIAVSLELLRAHLDAPVDHYSYPEGLTHCYSERVVEALRRRGVVCAPTAEPGVNRAGDDLFHLKRIMVT